MISFTNYIKNTFYNDIYNASEEYFLEHLEDLSVIDNDDDKVEITDIEVMYVYAGNREDDEIDIDILTNIYATVFGYHYNRDSAYEKNRWLRISCIGKPDAGIKNFRVKKVEPYEKGTYSIFENPLSGELIPFICKNELDKIAESFLCKYYPEALTTPTKISTERIVEEMGLQLRQEIISEDVSIFGQIYFQDNLEKGLSEGTIVIDKRLSEIRNEGVVRNTILHECVHWELHRHALKFLRVDKEKLSVLSTAEDIKCEDIADANRWMEWHAESIAPKILMPKKMFIQKAWVIRKRLLESSQIQDELDIVERWIDELAFFFGVPRSSAKVRLAECGFDIVKGAFIYIDDKYVPAHKWKDGYLENTQTFSINLIQLGMQLLIQPSLKSLVETGALIYVESHLCINDKKYISYDVAGNPFLTDYARHHMEECCVVFDIVSKTQSGSSTALTLLLNRDADSDIQFTISYSKYNNEWLEKIDAHVADTMEIMLKLQGLNNFGSALTEVMQWRNVRNQELADTSYLGLKAISNLRNGKTEPKLESVIAICVAMKLPPVVSKKLVELSGKVLRTGNKQEFLYDLFICSTGNWDVGKCNAFLVGKGFKELVHDRYE